MTRSLAAKTGWLTAVFLLALLAGAGVMAAGINWLPGFPMKSGASVLLIWTVRPDVAEYRVLRRVGDGEFREIYRGGQRSFSDNAAPADIVAYKVVAFAKGKEVDASPVAVIRGIEPLKPPSITGTIASRDSVTLRWLPPPGAVFSNVYRSEAEAGPYRFLGSVQTDTYIDRKVAAGRLYFYKISSADESGRESDKSPAIVANLKTAVVAELAGAALVRKVVPKGEFTGEEYYRFNQPSDVGVLPGGEVYVLDRRSIQFFDPDGTFLRRINLDPRWGLASEAVPDGDGGYLLVYYAGQLIRKVDNKGAVQEEVRYPPYDGPLPRRAAPAVAAVADNAAAAGAPEEEAAPKIPNNPNSLVVDPDGSFWVADGVRSQLIKVDPATGKAKAIIGRVPGTYDRKNLRDTDLPAVRKISRNPATGMIYAILGLSAEIKVIDPRTWKVVGTYGGIGVGNDRFQAIGALAFRKNGNVLVLDPLARVIKEFGAGFRYIATYADVVERDRAWMSMNLASTFAFLETRGRFYLCSPMGNKVYKYDIAD